MSTSTTISTRSVARTPRRIPWIDNPPRIEIPIPRFVKAFTLNEKYHLPMEIMLRIESFLKKLILKEVELFEEYFMVPAFQSVDFTYVDSELFSVERHYPGNLSVLLFKTDPNQNYTLLIFNNQYREYHYFSW